MEEISNPEHGEQPVTEPASTAGEQPPSEASSTNLDDYSSEDAFSALESVESGEPDERPKSESPTTQDTPAPTEPAGEQPQEPEDNGGEGASEEPDGDDKPTALKSPKRVSLKSLESSEQQMIADAMDLVRDGKAANFDEGWAQVSGSKPKPAAQEPQPGEEKEETPAAEAPAKDEPGADSKVTEIRDRITALREQRREAIQDFDRNLEVELTDQIEDAQAELLRAEQAAEQSKVEASKWEADYGLSVGKVEAKYPQAKDENSAFFRVLSDRIDAAEARGDSALRDPSFVERFADEVAADLGLNRKAPPAPPARPSRPVGGDLAPGHQSGKRIGRDEALRLYEQASDEERAAILFTE